MANRTARRPWERLTSMPPVARAGRWLGAGGRNHRRERSTRRVSRRTTYQHLRSQRETDGYGLKADGGELVLRRATSAPDRAVNQGHQRSVTGTEKIGRYLGI